MVVRFCPQLDTDFALCLFRRKVGQVVCPYVLAHISFVFLFLFLFGPIFAAAFFRSRHSKRATVFSVFMILNILSLAMGAMLLLTYVLAQLQAR
jgi:hypothetical protein